MIGWTQTVDLAQWIASNRLQPDFSSGLVVYGLKDPLRQIFGRRGAAALPDRSARLLVIRK